MESRALLSGLPRPPQAFLLSIIPETATLRQHFHPHLRIIIGGQELAVPGGIGILPTGNSPIHTHDDSGYLHVESTVRYQFQLRDFFTIWGQTFSRNNILGHTTDNQHRIVMTVNGKVSNAFGNLVVHDLDNIVIREIPIGRPGRG